MTDVSALIDKLSPQARADLARRLAEAGSGAPAGRPAAEPVALIGIGCRYPGSVSSPRDFWDLLMEGRDAIGPFPAHRWGDRVNGLADGVPPNSPKSGNPLRSGGFVDDADCFDAAFFGISPSEAVGMDPQQRLLLEVAWEALEHAGVAPRSLAGSRTGVYVGIAAPDYLVERLHDPTTRNELHTVTGAIHSTAVGRLSYLLDLRGPSVAVDTACSSSLVSVHLACQSLHTGDSDLVLAGGVHVISSVLTSFGLRSAGLAGENGRCRTFDASADGIARAEGCGVVVLKRLSDAQRDGDRILAVIRGSAVNQDGRSTSLTAPSVTAQRDVLGQALRRAGVPADHVGMVETHGTGTVLGDPIEVEALTAVYGRGDLGGCALGAVKTNFGHSEEAAGVAGLIKAALAVRAGVVPPNLHFEALNPDITLAGTQLVVPRTAMPWPNRAPVRYAAVSSFGMGGTNAHVVIAEPPAPPAEPDRERKAALGPFTVPLSAGSPAALRATARRVLSWARGPGSEVPAADIAHTLGRRSPAEERAVVVCATPGDARRDLFDRLGAYVRGEPVPGLAVGSVLPGAHTGTVWVFPGQGGQWAGMGRDLLAHEPAFAAAVAEIDPLVRQECGFSVRDLIAEGADPDADLPRSHVMIYAVQVALARTWTSYGLRPAAVIGQSLGEAAAAVVAGGLSLLDGVRVVWCRARLLAGNPATRGRMAMVELAADEVAERLAEHSDVSVAALSGPGTTVVSGATATVERLVERWEEEGLFARLVKGVTITSHCPRVDPLLPELRETLRTLPSRTERPPVRFYSTACDSPREVPAFDADYWAANLRNPVRSTGAVAAGIEDGFRVFLEVSPHPVCGPQIAATARAAGVPRIAVVGSLRRAEPERLTLLTALAQLHCHGVPVSLPLPRGSLAEVPTTAWDHRRYWLRESGAAPGAAPHLHPLLGVHVALPGPAGDHVWQARLSAQTLPWLAQHRVGDVPVLPGTAYCEMVLAAACTAFDAPPELIALEDVDYRQLLLLSEPVTVTVTLRPAGPGRAAVEVVAADGPDCPTVHASARVRLVDAAETAAPPVRDLPALLAAHPDRRDAQELYRGIRAGGQRHGPAFRGTAELRLGPRQERVPQQDGPPAPLSAVSRLARPAEATAHPLLHTHPALLDGWFHVIAAVMLDRSETYLPAGLGTLRLYGDPDRASVGRAVLRPAPEGGGLVADVELLDDAGQVVIEAQGILLRETARAGLPFTVRDRLFTIEWQPAPLPDTAGRDPRPVLAVGPAPAAGALRDELERAGRACATAEPGDERALRRAVGDGVGDVVLLLAPEPVTPAPSGPAGDEQNPQDAAEARVLAAARVAGTLATGPSAAVTGPARLWLVTRGARRVAAGDVPDLAQQGLRGLTRSLALECPDLRATLVDLDPARPGWADLAAELTAAPEDTGTQDEIAWRGAVRSVARLRRTAPPGTGARRRRPVVRPGSGYLVTGGLSGVGLHTAGWLAARGAGCLVLCARSEPGEQAGREIERMREFGADVRVVRGDIAEPGTADLLVQEVADGGCPLRGVIHSAMVLDDCLLPDLDARRLTAVWRPKAIGAWRLHRATAGADLDWWVCYSSAASLLGAAGQAGYAAANAFVDALAEWRAARGLPALSINWGGWAEIGSARDLTHEALPMMPPAEGMAALAELIGSGAPTAGAMRLDLEAMARTMPETKRSSFFAPLLAAVADRAPGTWAGPDALRGLPPGRLRAAVAARVRECVAQILGYRAESLDPGKPLTRMGLDSLMAVKTKNGVLADFGVSLPVARLLQGASVTELVDRITAELGGGATDPRPASEAVARARQRAAARRTSRTPHRRNT